MRICHWFSVLVAATVIGHAADALAETRYISDQLVVSLRPAPQDSAKAMTYLKTDTAVEVLEEGDSYTKVRTAEGETGYIQSSYLTAETPKPTIIRRLSVENTRLEEQIAALEQRYDEAFTQEQGARQQMIAELERAQQQVAALQTDLAAANRKLDDITTAYQTLQENSQNISAITAERDRLKQTHAELTEQVDRLTQVKDQLAGGHRRQWFLAGAGVLVLGWLIGKFSRTRRRNGY